VIAYRKQGITLARLNENVWNIETVDSTVTPGASLAMVRDDTNDSEHLVYDDGRYSDLGYAVWAPAWQQRPVGAGDRPSLGLRNGRPHIFYRSADVDPIVQLVTGLPGPTWGARSLRAGVGERPAHGLRVEVVAGGQHLFVFCLLIPETGADGVVLA
jgi:hypothetical protein